MYPRIVVSGPAHTRGRQYGQAARELIGMSIDGYRTLLCATTGWSWPEIRRRAMAFKEPIAEFDPRYLAELTGIAEGARVELADVLAINVRTEILAAGELVAHRPGHVSECTSFAVLPGISASNSLMLGQTWDWSTCSTGTPVVLEAHQDDGPDFVTIVEAGLLAKFGMNSSGVGLAANALNSGEDSGEIGVPFHVLLRAVLESDTAADALTALQRERRASSANYLLATGDGLAVDVEATPGLASGLYLEHPLNGVLVHANHFTNPGAPSALRSSYPSPSSPLRLQRLRGLLESSDDTMTPEFLQSALCDHAGYPFSVCTHSDLRVTEAERSETQAAVVMDLAARQMWLASGQPCAVGFELLDLSSVLSKAPPRSADCRLRL